jgi:hypothetical protein
MARTTITATKEQLHRLIDRVEDADLLELYLQLLLKHSGQATYEPTAEEISAVEEGLESVKQYGTVSHEEAVKRLRDKYPNLLL